MSKKERRGRKKQFGPQAAVRLSETMARLVDSEVKRLQAESPARMVTRADVIRTCIYATLAKKS